MQRIKKEVTINAPLERVYNFMTDPESLAEIWPSLAEVSNVKRQPDGSHSFDFVYKMVGIRFKGHVETPEVEQHKKVVARAEGGIPSTFHYSYESHDGATKLTMEVEYELPGKVLGKLAEPLVARLNEHEADNVLHNLKTRLEYEAEKAA